MLGTGTTASASYAIALGAAYDVRRWLVTFWAIAGGAAYALSGRRWLDAYRAQPTVHGRGESTRWLALLGFAASAGLGLLLINS